MGLLKWSAFILIALILIASILQYFSVKQQLKPLHYLLDGIHEASKGNFALQLPLRTK